MGGVGALAVDGPDLARIITEKLGGRHYDLHAPVLVEKTAAREMFMAEPAVRNGIVRAQSAQLAITGMGAIHEDTSSFLRAGLFNRADLVQLIARGNTKVLSILGTLRGKYIKILVTDDITASTVLEARNRESYSRHEF